MATKEWISEPIYYYGFGEKLLAEKRACDNSKNRRALYIVVPTSVSSGMPWMEETTQIILYILFDETCFEKLSKNRCYILNMQMTIGSFGW